MLLHTGTANESRESATAGADPLHAKDVGHGTAAQVHELNNSLCVRKLLVAHVLKTRMCLNSCMPVRSRPPLATRWTPTQPAESQPAQTLPATVAPASTTYDMYALQQAPNKHALFSTTSHSLTC